MVLVRERVSPSKSPSKSPRFNSPSTVAFPYSDAGIDVPDELELTLLRWPFSTSWIKALFKCTWLFLLWAVDTAVYCAKELCKKQELCFTIIGLLVAFFVGRAMPGPWTALVASIELQFWVISWWFGLGILSSVGLGTGMHSGILFLFPHMLKVCDTAARCGHLDFDSQHDTWFKDPTLDCGPNDPESQAAVSFLGLFMKVFWPALLWGAGTACGEIPPYAIAYAASVAGEKNTELQELETDYNAADLVTRMKIWMIDFLKRHGFIGVLVFSAWPNALFDLCGICCGHFQMPFWTFFGGTFMGKALIKVHMQSIFFITLFRQEFRESALATVASLSPTWVHEKLKKAAAEGLNKFEKGSAGEAQPDSPLKQAWDWLIFIIIAFFVISCIEQLAQLQHAKTAKSKTA